MQKPVEKAGAIVLVLLIAGCTSNSTKPTEAFPPDVRDQRQEEQRKQDRQQHEMERGELGKGDRFVFRT
jgi:type IV pilus biogenesis protein CpaD/CtpE